LEEPKGRSAEAGVAVRPARTKVNAKSVFMVVLHSSLKPTSARYRLLQTLRM
jgi:hypothetical protein